MTRNQNESTFDDEKVTDMSSADEGDDRERRSEEKTTWRNLPNKKQLLMVSFCRLSTPLSNACILPYLYDLAKFVSSDLDHPTAPQEISRITGILVAAFPIGQVLTSMLWGRLSDSYGRKPVIILGLIISIAANIAFGFSRTIGMLCFWRVIAGMGNGTTGVMRTVTAELGGRKHLSRAFLAPPVVFNSGRVIALAVGGCLANPVVNMPSLFGPSGVFNNPKDIQGVKWLVRYPYALPAIFNAVSLAMVLFAATLWMRETLLEDPSNNEGMRSILGRLKTMFRQRPSSHRYALIDGEDKDGVTPVQTPRTLAISHNKPRLCEIWTRTLSQRLVLFALLPLHNAAFLHIFPVFLSMPVTTDEKSGAFRFRGGLGLPSPKVGTFLAALGIVGILLQLFIYPRVHGHMGTLGVFRFSGCIFPLAYTLAPYLALLAPYEHVKGIGMTIILLLQVLARTMAIPSSVILLTEAAPHRNVLGTIHGAGNTLSALASACGPAIAGLIMAKGIEIGAIGLVWWTWMTVASLASLVWSFLMRKARRQDIAGNDLS